MKEDCYINFETALLAKEKGFRNDYAKYYYSETGLSVQRELGYICPHKPMKSYQFELQKWLREKHNIHVYAICNFYNRKPLLGYIYELDVFDENNIHDGKDYDNDQIMKLGDEKAFKSYEEALEAGLLEALKLI